MRTLSAIDADITVTAAKLNDLHAEREGVRRGQIEAVLVLFDAGRNAREIARSLRMNKNTVAGILWRAGRTEKGRAAIRQQMLKHAAAAAPA